MGTVLKAVALRPSLSEAAPSALGSRCRLGHPTWQTARAM